MSTATQRKYFEKQMYSKSQRSFMEGIIDNTNEIEAPYIQFQVQTELVKFMTSDKYIQIQMDIVDSIKGKTPEQIAVHVAKLSITMLSYSMIENNKNQF